MEEIRVELPASDKSPVVVQPTDRPFHNPSPGIASHSSAIVRPIDPPTSVRTEQDPSLVLEEPTQRIAVIGAVSQQIDLLQSPKPPWQTSIQLLNQGRLRLVGTIHQRSQRQTASFDHQLNLAAFPAFCQPDSLPPLSAATKVASVMSSSKFNRPDRRRTSITRSHTFCQTPARVQSRCRRQHVTGEGK